MASQLYLLLLLIGASSFVQASSTDPIFLQDHTTSKTTVQIPSSVSSKQNSLQVSKLIESAKKFTMLDDSAPGQTFDHLLFGPIYYPKTLPCDFVRDSYDKRTVWMPGSLFYRESVLSEEKIDPEKAYKNLQGHYVVNHPDFACQYSTLMIQLKPKIPLITHTIWLTNPSSPVQLRQDFIEGYKESCKNHRSEFGWQHFFWIQDGNKLQETIAKLSGTNIQIMELDKTLTETDFQDLKPHFDIAVSQKKFGRASDILRCVVLRKYGGIYRDTDFIMTRPFTALALAYDFFAGIEHAYSYPCNAIMGCRPGHPIMTEMINVIARNFDPKRAPEYVKNSFEVGNELLETLCLTGPIVLGVCVKKIFLSTENSKLEHAEDKNIILAPGVFFDDGKKEDAFGTHAFALTWLNKKEFGSDG